MTERQKPKRRHLALVTALPALLAALLYLPTVWGDLLCDDLLIVKSLLPDGTGNDIDWSVVGQHFGGAWYGVTQVGYYRPLLTLSFAIDAWIGGGSIRALHATNIVLHSLASFLCAWLCAECSPRRPRFAALVGGLLLALHPIATETVSTLSCRNTTIEMVFRLASMLAFVRYLKQPGRGRLLWVAAWAGLALLSKESALLLPIAYVVLDVVLSPARPWRERLRPHILMCTMWIGYMLLRLALLGTMQNPVAAGVLQQLLALDPGSLPVKLGNVFWPRINIDGSVEPMTISMLVLVAFVCAVSARRRVSLTVLTFGFVWIIVQSLPTHVMGVGPGMINSRYSYGLLTTVALLMSLIVAHPDLVGAKMRRWVVAAVIVNLACLTYGSVRWIGLYFNTWNTAREMQRTIDTLGETASESRPLAFASIAWKTAPELLVRQQLFAYTERPRATGDYPMVNLTSVLTPGRPHETIDTLFHDASPLRAVWQHGSEILIERAGGEFNGPRKDGPAPDLNMIRHPRRERTRRFTFAAPVSPFYVEALRMRMRAGDEPARLTGRLRWIDAGGGMVGNTHIDARATGDSGAALDIDVVSDLSVIGLSLVRRNNLRGFEFEFTGPDREIMSVEVVTRVPELELARSFAGAVVPFNEFHATIKAPGGTRGSTMRLVVLGPDTVTAQPVTPGRTVRLTDEMQRSFRVMLPLYNQKLYYYYFEERADPATGRIGRRSELDRFRLGAPRGL